MTDKVESGTLTSSKVTNTNLNNIHSLILTHNYFILKNELNYLTYEHKKTEKMITIKITRSLDSSYASYIFTYEPTVSIEVSVPLLNSGKYYKTTVESYEELNKYLENYFTETVNVLTVEEEDTNKENMKEVLNELKDKIYKYDNDEDEIISDSDNEENNTVIVDPLDLYNDLHPNGMIKVMHQITIPYIHITLFMLLSTNLDIFVMTTYMFLYYLANAKMLEPLLYLIVCNTIGSNILVDTHKANVLLGGSMLWVLNFLLYRLILNKDPYLMDNFILSLTWSPYVISVPFFKKSLAINPSLNELLDNIEDRIDNRIKKELRLDPFDDDENSVDDYSIKLPDSDHDSDNDNKVKTE